MPPKRNKTSAAAAATTTRPASEPLRPGHTRAQGTRLVRDHNGDPISEKPATDNGEPPSQPS